MVPQIEPSRPSTMSTLLGRSSFARVVDQLGVLGSGLPRTEANAERPVRKCNPQAIRRALFEVHYQLLQGV